ncbi:MAG: DNA glycosylase AlkZ-like family protein, partial [Pseudonocardiaceae bacterium]
MTTPHDIALLRLAAQRIAGPGFATATDAVRWLTAAQAQDYPGAVTSIALRTESRTRQSVEVALNAGEVVRSWPMRGTLHFVLAEDLPWMLGLTTGRLLAGAASRRAALGLDMHIIDPEREEALGEWVLRYFHSHGPATVKDFAWWTKLVAADVKTGLA